MRLVGNRISMARQRVASPAKRACSESAHLLTFVLMYAVRDKLRHSKEEQ